MKRILPSVVSSCLVAWFGTMLGCEPSRAGADRKVHLAYWDKWTGVEGEAAEAVVEAFNRSQDDIEVEYLAVSPLDRKTLVATAGGDPPDVVGLVASNIYSFADQAALTPLDGYIEHEGQTVRQWLARYEPVFGEMGLYRDKLWSLPSTPATIALHWNKALFREAGLDPERPPETVEELDRFAEKLTRRNAASGKLEQAGFLPQEARSYAWSFPIWFGASLWDGARVTANTTESQAAFGWVASYSQSYGSDALKAFMSGLGNNASPQSGFLSGKVAMILQGVWLDNFVRRYAPGLEYGVAAWPRAPGGPRGFSVTDSDVLVIPRGAKHPDEAWRFIRYVSSSNLDATSREELSGLELLCFLQAKNSPLARWSPFFEKHHPHPHIELFRELGSSGHAATIPKMGIWQEYAREMALVFDQVRLLEKPPAAALDDCQSRVESSWSWHQRSLARRAAAYAADVGPAKEP